jgi:CheY-like chemotaxis protein
MPGDLAGSCCFVARGVRGRALKKRILVVDDDPLMLEVLGFALQRAGYEVRTASDGEEALQLLSDLSRPIPHVVVTDLQMPRRNGAQLLAQIETDPRLQGIRGILISADATAGRQVRCDAFIAKDRLPFELMDTLFQHEEHNVDLDGDPRKPMSGIEIG